MDRSQSRKQVLEKLKNIDSQIDVLSKLKEKLLSELKNLSAEHPANQKPPSIPNSLTKEKKIRLFKSLFRGRDDVYARLWISKKTGKKGYSPICQNEWAAGVCKKPTIKCADCPNREFVSLSEEVIVHHLEGTCVIGVYPMLTNEHCFFLAADFDKEEWMNDVMAFKSTCDAQNVPVAIERSQSGNGAHAWIFFSDEIPASMARKLGSILLTKTMSNYYQLDMKSYDRLFPNQDTLPKGGFGNLIALPLQRMVRKYGNSVFIDDEGNPYENQWLFLASIKRMSYRDVEEITKGSAGKSQMEGIRNSPQDEKDSPWIMLPSGKTQYKARISDLPDSLNLVVANRIYINTNDVPSILLNQLKRLAAFHNPEFYRRQSMRFSTHATPRIICCSEIIDDYLALPRGCLDDVYSILKEYGIDADVEDKKFSGKKKRFNFVGTLTDEQKKATRKMNKKDVGILVAPPGAGKTVLAIHMMAKRKTNVLVLVHRKPLMEQWRLQIAAFLGLDVKEIGQIGSGKDKSFGVIDIAMIQSMERKGVVDDRVADYGFIIVDECHHIGAVSFERVMMQAKSKYVLGLTATPYRRDGHQPIIHMQCGPVVAKIKQENINNHISEFSVLSRLTEFSCEWTEDSKIYEIWPKLIENNSRNQMIIADIFKAIQEGRLPIILTERRSHLEYLAGILQDKVDHLAILHGGLKAQRRKTILEEFKSDSNGHRKALLATGSYVGEGFDDPRLDTLFLTMPISFKGKIVQYAGRLHREYQGKQEVRIYDYVDHKVPVLARMHQKRLKTYKTMGYAIHDNCNSIEEAE